MNFHLGTKVSLVNKNSIAKVVSLEKEISLGIQISRANLVPLRNLSFTGERKFR